MTAESDSDTSADASWARWGRVVLYAEMLIAISTTVFALSVALNGAGFP